MNEIENWLRFVLEGIVSHPDKIIIQTKNDDMGILFTVSSHKDDCGKLIGRNGEHVNALRVMLRTCGHARNVKASLKIIAD